MSVPPIWRWDGEAAWPLQRFRRQIDAEMVVGELYHLDPIKLEWSKRDQAFHCTLRDLYANIPERLHSRFASYSYDDFRRHCLIETGYVTIREIAMPSKRAAEECAMFFGRRDKHTKLLVKGYVIQEITAKSQAMRGGMTPEERRQSYKDVLDYAAGLVGVSAQDARQHAGQAA